MFRNFLISYIVYSFTLIYFNLSFENYNKLDPETTLTFIKTIIFETSMSFLSF